MNDIYTFQKRLWLLKSRGGWIIRRGWMSWKVHFFWLKCLNLLDIWINRKYSGIYIYIYVRACHCPETLCLVGMYVVGTFLGSSVYVNACFGVMVRVIEPPSVFFFFEWVLCLAKIIKVVNWNTKCSCSLPQNLCLDQTITLAKSYLSPLRDHNKVVNLWMWLISIHFLFHTSERIQ